MNYRIVKGKFLPLDKLNVLLEANGISIEYLISGAKKTLDELRETGREENEKASEHFDKYMEHFDRAANILEECKVIKSALDQIDEKPE